MVPETGAFISSEERPLVKDAMVGMLAGIVVFGLVTMLIVRLGWPEESWGFAAVTAVFVAPWAGVFFGSAAGIAYFQSRPTSSHIYTESEDEAAPVDDSHPQH